MRRSRRARPAWRRPPAAPDWPLAGGGGRSANGGAVRHLERAGKRARSSTGENKGASAAAAPSHRLAWRATSPTQEQLRLPPAGPARLAGAVVCRGVAVNGTEMRRGRYELRKTSPGTAVPSSPPPRPAKAAVGGQSRGSRPRNALVTLRPRFDPRLGNQRPSSHERQRNSKSTSVRRHMRTVLAQHAQASLASQAFPF